MFVEDAQHPARFLRNIEIEQEALTWHDRYYSELGFLPETTIDMEDFVGSVLGIPICISDIPDQDGAVIHARYFLDSDNCSHVQINKKYKKELFDRYNYFYRSTLGHEAGHHVLKHLIDDRRDSTTPSLFENSLSQRIGIHRQFSFENKMNSETISEWKNNVETLKYFLLQRNNEEIRQAMACILNRGEPDWMFRQAEHFSACLLVPRYKLLKFLERNPDLSGWHSIGKLARQFNVSITLMKVRLQKLKLILQIGESDPTPNPDGIGLYSKLAKVFGIIPKQRNFLEEEQVKVNSANQ